MDNLQNYPTEHNGMTYDQFKALADRHDADPEANKAETNEALAKFVTPRDDLVLAKWSQKLAEDRGDLLASFDFFMLGMKIEYAIESGEVDPDVPLAEQRDREDGDDPGE